MLQQNLEDFLTNILSNANLFTRLKINLKWGLDNGKGFGHYSSIIKKTIRKKYI